MKTLFTIITAIALFALNINAQNIPWSADYSGGECTLSMPEWSGFVGESAYDDGFIHTVSLSSGTDGYDGQVLPNQAKVVRVLMAPGVEAIQVSGTWSHSYSGKTLHGFLHGDTNQVGGFTPNFEPGQVCVNGCSGTYIDTTELYLYANFLDDQKTITRTELGIPITQPIWVSYVMYQKHDTYTNENISLTFNCNVIGSTNVQVYRDWLTDRPWNTTPGTGTYDGIQEWFDDQPEDPCASYVPGEISGPIEVAPSTNINISSLQDASGSDNITYNWYVWGLNGYGNETMPVDGETGNTFTHIAPDMDFINNEGGLFFIYFKRQSVAGCGFDETETILVKVYSTATSCDVDLTPGTINKTDLTFCDGTAPGEFQSLVAAEGSGNITYQWQGSIDLGNTWSNIDNATSETFNYNLPIDLGLTETSDDIYYQVKRRAFDDCNNSFDESNVITLTYTYCDATNINSIIENTVNIFPNPAHNSITIAGTVQNQNIKIYDIMGKELLNTNKLTINISNFERGIYFVKVDNTISKFIKE